ncbi:MAG: TauD/TfdA family dioxygenase [Rhodospirillaceae bacterium]
MTEIYTRPVTDKSAWTAEELAADPNWIRHITEAEAADIDRAVEALLSKGMTATRFARDDAPSPAMAALADWALTELEFGRGIALIRGLDVDKYDRRALDCLYWVLGVHLGMPRHQNPQGDLIGEVTDKGFKFSVPLNRGYLTRDKLGFHCDGLDIVSLLCVRTAREGGESYIASSMAVFNDILANHPEFLPPLFEGFYFNLRGEGEVGESLPTTRHRVPVYSYFDGRLSCRLLSKAIREGQEFKGEPLTGLASDALQYMQDVIPTDKFRFDITFNPGDIQILNNYVALHARAPYEDWPEPERKRLLLRLWVNLRDGRKLAPEFSDRYNMGPREPMRLKNTQAA